jgi:hypothetical protein
VTVQNQRPTCPGELVESAPGVGECERGDECAVAHLRADYFTYRDAHARITAAWAGGGGTSGAR